MLSPLSDVEFLREFAQTRRYLAGRPAGTVVLPQGKAALFLRSEPTDNRQMLYELDLTTGQARVLLTPELVLAGAAETLSPEEKARLERQRVSARGFIGFKVSPDGARVLVPLSGKLYVLERLTGKVTALRTGPGPCLDARFSPDGKHVSFVRAHDVHVVELASNVEAPVTTGGTEVAPNGTAEFVAQEEMKRHTGYWWAPDGGAVAYQTTDNTGVEVFSVPDPLHPESRGDTFFYPRPGKANARVGLKLASLKKGAKPVVVQWDAQAFPYLVTVRWPTSGPLTVVVQDRLQTRLQVLAVDVKTGRTTRLLESSDPAWVNIEPGFPLWVKGGTHFFWMTEASGGPEVVLHDASGKAVSTWVPRAAGFADLVGFHEGSQTLYFTGGPEPTVSQVYRVTAGGPVEAVPVPGEGPSWTTASLSEDALHLAVTTTSLSAMPRTVVVKAPEGKQVAVVPSVAVEPSLKVSAQVVTLPGPTAFRAMVLKPRTFRPGQAYPVVLQVYGGPGHLEVFHSLREQLVLQWLANQGFLVVKLDGRGTPRRGRDWERAIKHDFATGVMDDQLLGLRQLKDVVPELDLSRVGVTGWSFGGYLASLLTLAHPEAIKSGVAGAPVVDWLDYDTHYTERYLGLPESQPEAYRRSNVLSHVGENGRPLLLIHGTADDNVYFLHSLKLSDALFKAGQPHSVLPLTNFTHMVPDPLVTRRLYERIARWFQETL